MANRQCISNDSSPYVFPALMVYVKNAYVAMDIINTVYMRVFRALPVEIYFQMADSRIDTVDASPIRLMTSVAGDQSLRSLLLILNTTLYFVQHFCHLL